MKIFLLSFVVVLLAVSGGALWFRPQLTEALGALKPEPSRTSVRIESIAPGKLVETVSAPGEIEPHTKVDISAEVSARIVELPYREGETVQKGDIIVRLDDEDLRAIVASSLARRDEGRFRMHSEEARLAGLLKTREFAKRTLERQQALYETGDVSRSALDDAQERMEDLNANIEAAKHTISVLESSLVAAEADIDRAKDALGNTVIHAPMGGVITMLNMEIGEQVLGTFNNAGTVIMTIADLSRMILNARVAESDIAQVSETQPARIYINAYPDDVFEGSIRHIGWQRAGASDGTGFFETEIELQLEETQQIRSGLVANVDIEVASHDGLIIPSQAIVERLVEELPEKVRNDELVDTTKKVTYVVYRVIDGKAACTPVKPGPSDLTHTVVAQGLNDGDGIIVGPYKALETLRHDELVRDLEEAETESPESPDETAGDSEVADAAS